MKYSLLFISILMSFLSFSQDDLKRNTYKGNIFYHDSEFEDAKYYYEKAVAESGFNFKANFNLANTYVRLEEFDKAIETYEKIAEYTNTNEKKAKIYHNIGNAYMFTLNQKEGDEPQKIDEAVEKVDHAIDSYKSALRANSRDEETRYNLAYALLIKKKLDEQQKQEQKDNKDSDKNDSDDKKEGDKSDSDQDKDGDKKDGDKDKGGDESEDEKESDKDKDGDKSDDEKESDKDSDEKDDKDSDGKPKDKQPQQQKISKAQAKRILEAAEKAEKEIQDKLNKQKVIVGEKGKKGTKKDW